MFNRKKKKNQERLYQRLNNLEQSHYGIKQTLQAWPSMIAWSERVRREYLHWLQDRGWTLTSGRNYLSGQLDYTVQHPRHGSHRFSLEEAIDNEEEFQKNG